MNRPLRILSLGAGVQSTTVGLMSTTGDIDPIDCAIFADTGWEPQAVYDHLAKLEAHLADHGVPVYRVTAGNIREDHVDPQHEHLFIKKPIKNPDWRGRSRTFIPVHVVHESGSAYRNKGDTSGIMPRTCTRNYKIDPIEKKVRELLGLGFRARWPLGHVVDELLGISWDESQRMSTSKRPAIRLAYPLIDKRYTRRDCLAWLADHGWTAPRSACIGCPFHRNDEWRAMRDHHPDEWADAIDFDHRFRARQSADLLPMRGTPYLHSSHVPLDQADIDEPIDPQLTLFGDDCEGFCGT